MRALLPEIIHFDDYELDLGRYELRRGDRVIKLEKNPMELLILLVENPGRLVTREQIIHRLWGDDVFVDTRHGVNTAVHKLRSALRDDSEQPRILETVVGKGYRLIAATVPRLHESTDKVTEFLEPNPELGNNGRAASPLPKQPWSRFLSIARSLGLALLAIIFIRILFPKWFSYSPTTPPRGIVTLAVRPLKDLDADPYWEFLATGLTEEMVTRLGQLHPQQMLVVRLTSGYAAASLDKLAKDLNADYVLEGGVRKIDQRVAITAQLVQVGTQSVVWGQHYDREVKDLLRVQDEVATAITGEVLNKLPNVAAPAREVNREAYLAYLEGRHFWNQRTTASLTRARALFQRSIDIDPSYAPSYAGLAFCYELLGSPPYTALPPNEAFPQAKKTATKALELDNTLAEAHVVLGYSEMVYDLNLSGARQEFSLALQLHPDYATGHQFYAYYLTAIGDLKGAITERRRALELDPVTPLFSSALGEAYYQNREFDRAIEQNSRALELDPAYAIALVNIGRAYEMKGMHAEARSVFQKILAAAPNDPAVLALMGHEYATSGDRARALKTISHLKQLSAHRYVPAIYMALVYTGLHARDRAFEWLNRAADERCEYLVYLPSEPLADPLRSDPRFERLLNRLGLKPLDDTKNDPISRQLASGSSTNQSRSVRKIDLLETSGLIARASAGRNTTLHSQKSPLNVGITSL